MIESDLRFPNELADDENVVCDNDTSPHLSNSAMLQCSAGCSHATQSPARVPLGSSGMGGDRVSDERSSSQREWRRK